MIDLDGPTISVVLPYAVAVSTIISIIFLLLPSTYSVDDDHGSDNKPGRPRFRATVFVAGDIGRSPRMQYHALSLAKRGADVQLVGHVVSSVHPEVKSHDRISIVGLPVYPASLQPSSRVGFAVAAPFKVLFQAVTMFWCLAYRTKPAKWMVVQNPPAIPTIPISLLVGFLRRSRLVVDWHNYGFSILALKLGPAHTLVRLARFLELGLSRCADFHFAVTNAMSDNLSILTGGSIRAMALHDRPEDIYQRVPSPARRAILTAIEQTADYGDEISRGKRRLVVSATSWTADEDFSILLDALIRYYDTFQQVGNTRQRIPPLLVVITGLGPLKQMYEDRISKYIDDGVLPSDITGSSPIVIRTGWLTAIDYSRLLACADIGISLHQSTSGLDLPMKVVDMFGTGLPVLGWCDPDLFPAWVELVKEAVNGHGFVTSTELADLLVSVLGDPAALRKLRRGAAVECLYRWDDEWNKTASRLFNLDPLPKKPTIGKGKLAGRSDNAVHAVPSMAAVEKTDISIT